MRLQKAVNSVLNDPLSIAAGVVFRNGVVHTGTRDSVGYVVQVSLGVRTMLRRVVIIITCNNRRLRISVGGERDRKNIMAQTRLVSGPNNGI